MATELDYPVSYETRTERIIPHMNVGVPKEIVGGERRVALVPELVAKLIKAGLEVRVQPGAGTAAGFVDSAYQEHGARLEPDIFPGTDIVLKVQPPTPEETASLKEGAVLIGLLQPYSNGPGIQALAGRKATCFALELMPRITRAQSMDA